MNEEMEPGCGPVNKVILLIPTLLTAGSGARDGKGPPLAVGVFCRVLDPHSQQTVF